jgi:hypothetical protein
MGGCLPRQTIAFQIFFRPSPHGTVLASRLSASLQSVRQPVSWSILGSKVRVVAVGGAMAVLGAVAPVSAAPLPFVDYGWYTHDPNTGLDWLDVTTTANLSYETVTGRMASGGSAKGVSLEGWRYALAAEVTEFAGAFAGAPGSSLMYDYDGDEGGGWIDVAVSTLGDTNTFGGDFHFTYGITADLVDTLTLNVGRFYDYMEYTPLGVGGSSDDFEAWHTAIYYLRAEPYIGSFLVRTHAVPEPSTLALLGAGLALVGWRRGRRRA